MSPGRGTERDGCTPSARQKGAKGRQVTLGVPHVQGAQAVLPARRLLSVPASVLHPCQNKGGLLLLLSHTIRSLLQDIYFFCTCIT